jgi:hypothetical protein
MVAVSSIQILVLRFLAALGPREGVAEDDAEGKDVGFIGDPF